LSIARAIMAFRASTSMRGWITGWAIMASSALNAAVVITTALSTAMSLGSIFGSAVILSRSTSSAVSWMIFWRSCSSSAKSFLVAGSFIHEASSALSLAMVATNLASSPMISMTTGGRYEPPTAMSHLLSWIRERDDLGVLAVVGVAEREPKRAWGRRGREVRGTRGERAW